MFGDALRDLLDRRLRGHMRRFGGAKHGIGRRGLCVPSAGAAGQRASTAGARSPIEELRSSSWCGLEDSTWAGLAVGGSGVSYW